MEANFFDLELETKPDFLQSMKRVYAWYEGDILDRVPVRFAGHNEEFNTVDNQERWESLEQRWFDVEYRIDSFLEAVRGRRFLGETFPVFWPNLGPNVFAAMLGGSLEFGDVTSWIHPFVSGPSDLEKIVLDKRSIYYKKLLELTSYALDKSDHQFMVGYTDMHPGLDCVDAVHGTTEVCMGLYDNPDFIRAMVDRTFAPFMELMDDFHGMLKEQNQLSVSWLNIPSYEGMHIPSCDLGTMLSQEAFNEFALPAIIKEVECFQHNIFHVDGRGVARHIDALLEIEGIQGYQWVQGVGEDRPIMQWLEFIKKIQYHGKGVVVDLQPQELEPFIEVMSPKGIYLCINEGDERVQQSILERLLHWT